MTALTQGLYDLIVRSSEVVLWYLLWATHGLPFYVVVGVMKSCGFLVRVSRTSKDLIPTGCRSFATENTYMMKDLTEIWAWLGRSQEQTWTQKKVMHTVAKNKVNKETHEHGQAKRNKLYPDCKFFDDENSDEGSDSVVEAKAFGDVMFERVGVYSKVGRSELKAEERRVISNRQVVTNKGDGKTTNYRSKLVGREVKIDSRSELCAPNSWKP